MHVGAHAFELGAADWYRAAVAVARRVLHDPGDADDVASEVLLALWRNLDNLTSLEHCEAWIRAAARRRAIDFNRARHARQQAAMEFARIATVAMPSFAHNYLAPDLAANHLAILKLRADGYSLNEIAELTGLQLEAIRSRLRRARARARLRVVYPPPPRSPRSASAIRNFVLP